MLCATDLNGLEEETEIVVGERDGALTCSESSKEILSGAAVSMTCLTTGPTMANSRSSFAPCCSCTVAGGAKGAFGSSRDLSPVFVSSLDGDHRALLTSSMSQLTSALHAYFLLISLR
jgi:hypothetical protein